MASRDPKKRGDPGFFRPFEDLKRLKREAKAAPPSPPRLPPPPRTEAPDDDALFAQAVAGAKRLEDPRGHAPPPPPREARVVSDDSEALARLCELVSGDGDFDVSDTDEFIEGVAPGIDRRLLKSLRRGDWAVQGHLDLHGLDRAEAKVAVGKFLDESRRAGKRCVLVIHGRGLNSKDQVPVLKSQLKVWLDRGRLGRSVLAFSSARPCDGGTGALYLLLRR